MPRILLSQKQERKGICLMPFYEAVLSTGEMPTVWIVSECGSLERRRGVFSGIKCMLPDRQFKVVAKSQDNDLIYQTF